MRTSLLVLVFIAAAGCARTGTGAAAGDVDVGRMPIDATYIPRGVMLNGRLEFAVGVGLNKVGDRFTARLQQPLLAGSGELMLPREAQLSGHVRGLVAPTATKPGTITLEFSEISYFGRVRPLIADIVEVSPSDTPDPKTVTTATPLGAIVATGASGTSVSLGGPESGGKLPQASTFWIRLRQGIVP